MGSQQDVMNNFALQELKRIYSTFDGWKMTPQKQGSGYDTLVRLERLSGGHHDVVNVLVSFNKEISAASIDTLKKRENAPDGMVSKYDSAVLVPLNADTSFVPEGMKIFAMNSFSFEGDELVWMKKKVARAPAEPVKTAS